MELNRLNEKLANIKANMRVIIDKMYMYDEDCNKYDAYIEYYCTRRNKWGILHVLGKFSSEKKALDSAIDFLHLNHYKI